MSPLNTWSWVTPGNQHLDWESDCKKNNDFESKTDYTVYSSITRITCRLSNDAAHTCVVVISATVNGPQAAY